MLGFDALARLPLAAASADSSVSATLNATQAGNTAASTAAVGVSASLAQSQSANAVSSTGFGTLRAALSQDQAGNTANASVAIRVLGSLAQAQAGDVLSADGALSTGANATLDITQGADTVSAAGETPAKGSLNRTQAGNSITASGAVLVAGSVSATQAGNTIAAIGSTAPFLDADLTQGSQTVTSAARVRVRGALNATQQGNSLDLPPSFVVAPSYGHWVKTKNKPKAPTLPPPVEAGEIVIDEAFLRQMEEERLAALVQKAKQDALGRVEDLRAYAPAEKPPSRVVTLDRPRFDVVDTTPAIRTKVITLFRPPQPEPLKEPVRGSITLRALGPRRLPEPEIRKARTISLRRAPNRMTQTG